jgi:hypothetical protein
MSAPGGSRVPVEQAQVNDARMAAGRLARAQRTARAAQVAERAAAADLAAIHQAAVEKFGDVPCDPFLLDVLAMIDVRPDGTWHWKGGRNNKNCAVVRLPLEGRGSERSVVRYLALAFGLIGPDDHGTPYPTHGTHDVNPWHRVLRASAERQGNPHRFAKKAAS